MTAARLAAARVLVALEQGSTTLAHELERVRPAVEAAEDRRLLLELTAGALRWRNEIDALAVAASRRRLPDLDPAVRAVVRLGVYQLRHLDRVPARAVVHEAVDAVRALGQARATGFVNAVLRQVTRLDATRHLPGRPADQQDRAACLAYLTTTLSHPGWLAARWLDRYGFAATEAWCRYDNTPPEPAVRVRRHPVADIRARLAAAGVEATAGRHVERCLRLPQGALSRLPADLRPHLSLQDEGSQLVAESVPLPTTGRVIDACAAPGGKTLILADRLPPASRLVAADVRSARVRLLGRTLGDAARAVPRLRFDAARPWPFGPAFDTVLLDVPCTGLGTLRRDPDLKWTRSPDDLARFAGLQGTMIAEASRAVAPGGTLVYATCSSEPDENDAVVDAFLADTRAFSLARIEPGPGVRDGATLVDARGFLRTDPVRHGLDGYFAAALVRHGPA